jgi:hypothetical protein
VIAHESNLSRRRFPGLTSVDHHAKRRTAELDKMEREFKHLKEMVEEVLAKRE